MAAAAINNTYIPATDLELAAILGGDLICNAILRTSADANQAVSVRASELARSLSIDLLKPELGDLDAAPAVSINAAIKAASDLKLVRVVLVKDQRRFTIESGQAGSRTSARDVRWTLWSRFIDKNRPFNSNLLEIFNALGRPATPAELAIELAAVYQRPAEYYEELLPRLATPGTSLFYAAPGILAPVEWLLSTELVGYHPHEYARKDYEADVQFYNFLRDEETYDHFALAEQVQLGLDSDSISAFLTELKRPISAMALQFIAFHRLGETFNARAFYQALHASKAITLSTRAWMSTETALRLVELLTEVATQEVDDDEEANSQLAALPLEVDDNLIAELTADVLDADDVIDVVSLLDKKLDINSSSPTYNEDILNVLNALRQQDDVSWVGSYRLIAKSAIPEYVYSVPEILSIPDYSFTDLEGNEVDIVLEDEGLDGGLDRDVRNPMAQDVLDEEPVGANDTNPPSTARAVIKYHHKQIGTLPMCLFPTSFFPQEPEVLNVDFLLPGGQTVSVWVNNETRLIYGLYDWYQTIPIDSGATFTLERIAESRYIVHYNGESEMPLFFSRNRMNELMELQQRAEDEQLPTYELVRQIMEHYRKGIEFLTLHTEVNIVRRVPRRLTASILSGYHCFYQRGGAWVYDAKKLSQGLDRSKRKYLIKN